MMLRNEMHSTNVNSISAPLSNHDSALPSAHILPWHAPSSSNLYSPPPPRHLHQFNSTNTIQMFHVIATSTIFWAVLARNYLRCSVGLERVYILSLVLLLEGHRQPRYVHWCWYWGRCWCCGWCCGGCCSKYWGWCRGGCWCWSWGEHIKSRNKGGCGIWRGYWRQCLRKSCARAGLRNSAVCSAGAGGADSDCRPTPEASPSSSLHYLESFHQRHRFKVCTYSLIMRGIGADWDFRWKSPVSASTVLTLASSEAIFSPSYSISESMILCLYKNSRMLTWLCKSRYIVRISALEISRGSTSAKTLIHLEQCIRTIPLGKSLPYGIDAVHILSFNRAFSEDRRIIKRLLGH